MLSHHHSKNVLPSVQTATSFFPQFLALASGLTAKRLVSFTLHPLLDYLYTVIRTLLNLFFWTVSGLSAFPHERGTTFSVIFVDLFWIPSIMSMSTFYQIAHKWTQHSRCGLTIPEWEDAPLDPLAAELLLSRDTFSVLCPKSKLVAYVQVGVHEDFQVIFCKVAFHLYLDNWILSLVTKAIAYLPESKWTILLKISPTEIMLFWKPMDHFYLLFLIL